ncbi:hypothetical protein EDB86DRAFT_2793432 [Lactarius hatsudake]|nr:hypothetical protein EDB86DRAFT_2793432 [Lactarius hatsudake]
MSTFEPDSVIAVLKDSVPNVKRKDFEKNWCVSVDRQVKSWKTHRQAQAQGHAQLHWNAHIVEYVNFLNELTTVHGNSSKGTVANPLPKRILILGPRFVPPSYLHVGKRQTCPVIEPTVAYIKPLSIIHPFYYPSLSQCPQCESTNIKWDSWTPTGHREVHGMRQEECALGMQLRCRDCERQYGQSQHLPVNTILDTDILLNLNLR